MWTTSQRFWDALRAPSRRWATRVDVLQTGQLVTALDVVVAGKVTMDEVAVRRAATLELVDVSGTLTPADARDLLAPAGTEVAPYRGLYLPDGTVEWVPLGVLGVVEPSITSQAGTTRVAFSAHDRVRAVRARRFAEPYRVAAGTPTHTAIGAIITNRLGPNIAQRVQVTGATTPELVFDALSDPWDAVRDLAGADALSAFFDPTGTSVVQRDVPTRTGVRYEPGPESMLVDTERTISDERTYSGVRVSVEHPDQDPISVLVWDADPKSPTYYLGPFGARPYGYSSPAIKTQAQALAAAQTILPRVTGMRQEAILRHVGHPGHDVGDVVEVVDPATKTSGEWEVYGGTIPLRNGVSELKLRQVV